MHRKFRGKGDRYYCDRCGKLIFESIPKCKNEEISKVFGMPVYEYEYKHYTQNFVRNGKIFCSEECKKEFMKSE